MITLVTKNRRSYWETYGTIAEVLTYFKDHTHIGFDTETSGMSFMDSDLLCVQFGDFERQFVIEMDDGVLDELKPLFEKTLILQNSTFDLPFLYQYGIVPNIYDTLLAEKNLTLGLLVDRGLGDLVLRYCGVDLDKSKQKTIVQGLIDRESIEYAGLDVKYLIPIMEAQIAQAEKEQVINAITLDCRFARVAAYMEFCGIYVNKDALDKMIRKNEAYEYMAEEALYKWLETNAPEYYDPEFNWGSSKQVVELFNALGIPPVYNKQSGAQGCDIKELRKLEDPTGLLKLFIDYSVKRKTVSTYGRNWLEYIFDDGRVHSKFNVLVDTGRTSAGNTRQGPFPNLQNLSKKGGMRTIFEGKGPNRLIACDYSGQESVVLADISQEEKLLEFYRGGSGDLHSFVAKLLFPKELGDVEETAVADTRGDLRQLAKGANFAVAYGGTGYTISENLNIPRALGDHVYESFLNAFPGLPKFFEDNFQDTVRRGFVRINYVTGRKRKIDFLQDAVKRNDKRLLAQINRLSTNTKIQGTSADISKTAAVLFFEWILEKKLFNKVLINNFIHDELLVECHQSRAQLVADVLQEMMELAGTYFLSTLPLKAEPKIGKGWAK